MAAGIIENSEQLRERYVPASERARRKTLARLDEHCRRFIELSPFLCLGTSSEAGGDVSPRGDRPGNNRLDSFENLLVNANVGLLFLVPGVDETLRVNGVARISVDAALLEQWETEGKRPKSVIVVDVREAYLHCGKALIRSKLWHDDYKVERAALPSYGQMLKDQIEIADSAAEIDRSVGEGYVKGLY